jgi:hypothetical protein
MLLHFFPDTKQEFSGHVCHAQNRQALSRQYIRIIYTLHIPVPPQLLSIFILPVCVCVVFDDVLLARLKSSLTSVIRRVLRHLLCGHCEEL